MNTARSTDVAVVGCGVVGASVAWRLARLGLRVTCFDPDPGNGATFAAAGMLAPVTEAEFGEHDLTRMNVESARAWPAFAARLSDESGRGVGLRENGTLTVAFDSGDREQLRRLLAIRRGWGLGVEEITIDDARGMAPLLGPRVAAAMWAPGDHQVNPRLVIDALLATLKARHVPVIRRRIVRLEQTSNAVTGVVDETGESHPAGAVVVAAGWRSRELLRAVPDVDVPTRPVKGQIIRLDAASFPSFGMGRVIRGLVQARPVYLVPRQDGEIVVGATSEEQPDDRQVTAGGVFSVLRDVRALVPGIDELPVLDLTARARPGSPDNLPMIGRTGLAGLVVATGHYRNGILLAPLTADGVAAHVTGSAPPESLAAADPRRFGASVESTWSGGPA